MRDRVTFQRRTRTQTSLGGVGGGWQDLFASRAACLVPVKPYRKDAIEVVGARPQALALYELWVLFDSETATVVSDDRVVDARNPARLFKIRFSEDMGRRGVWLFFQLELGGANG